MVKGVDIGAIQGNVDFVWLKNQGYSFVICRNFVGNDFRDAMCDSNLQKAKSAGLYTGIYNFVYILPTDPAHPNRSPDDQAALHFANTPKNELVCIDLEFPAPGPDWQKWNVNAAFIDDWVVRYLEKYKQLSGLSTNQIVLYTYPNFAQSVKFRAAIGEYPLWYANYGTSPVMMPWTNNSIVMVQTSGGDKLTLPNGCSCDVDEAKDLSLWNIVTQTEIAPVPAPASPPVDVAPISIQATSTILAPQTTNNVATAENIFTSIVKVLDPIMPYIIQIVKTLLHIK